MGRWLALTAVLCCQLGYATTRTSAEQFLSHIHKYTAVNSHTHTPKYTGTHTDTRTHTDTYTRTHTYAHTYTHTHTHTQMH